MWEALKRQGFPRPPTPDNFMIQLPIASALVLDDLFVVGMLLIGYGFWLIASGLRLSELQIAQRAASFNDYSHVDAVQMASDKADAQFGVAYALLGIGLQSIAYLVQIGSGNEFEVGAGRALFAAFLMLTVIFIAIVLHRTLRPLLVRRIIVDVARCEPVEFEGRQGWTATALPSRDVLLGCAEHLPCHRRPGEPDEAFVRRAFRVKRTRTDRDSFEPPVSPRAAAMVKRPRSKSRA